MEIIFNKTPFQSSTIHFLRNMLITMNICSSSRVATKIKNRAIPQPTTNQQHKHPIS